MFDWFMVEGTMTAAYVTTLGGADNITVGPLPVPSCGSTDVLVRVEAAAVNLADTFVRSGSFPTATPMPYIVGTDLMGTVVEAGAQAPGFQPDQYVWCNSMGRGGRQGPTAEYAAVPADRLYHLPDGVDPHVAVALAQPAGTAYLGWFVHARLRPGETVFVGGGAGNVGTAAIQMAALAGARVIASARPDDHQKCRTAGAEAVFDYRDPELADRIANHAVDGVDVVWETSGHHDFGLVARVAAVGCRVLVTAASDDLPVPFSRLYTRDVSMLGFVISLAEVADLADAAKLINQMLKQGDLTTHVAQRLPMTQTAEAHRRIEKGGVRGRLIVSCDPHSATP
jgi:NADPH:quinone reductase-like Zn-dependent oxidoreductase